MEHSRCFCAFLLLVVFVVVKATESPETSCFETEKAQEDFGDDVKTCKEELKMPATPPKRFNPFRMMSLGNCVLGKKGAMNADGKPDKAKVKELITPYIKSEFQTAILKTYDDCLPDPFTKNEVKSAMGCIMMGYKEWGCVPAPGFKLPAFPGA